MNNNRVSRRGLIGGLGMAATGAGLAGLAEAAAGANKSAGVAGLLFDVREFGAVGDGVTNNSLAINKAVEAVATAGGGTVLVPAGSFLTGSVVLKDNITLHLAEGATLLGSPDIADYTGMTPDPKRGGIAFIPQPGVKYPRELSLIYAQDASNIALTGRGSVAGQGARFPMRDGFPHRPFLVKLVECRDVLITDLFFRESASWGIHLRRCERAMVRGITIFNHVNHNNDGIDIDCCRDVAVTQCFIDADDDAICLKSESPHLCENVTISDCVVSSHCNAIKAGTGSHGGFLGVTISNCSIVAPRTTQRINGLDRGISGVSLEIVDGGRMERVTVSNLTIHGVTLPLFIRLGDRHRNAEDGVGTLRGVIVSNIVATGVGPVGSSIAGIPGHPVEDVTLSNLDFTYEGGGTAEDAAREAPEKIKNYPEGTMFGTLPAYGFYCRHARGIKLQNVKLRVAAADARPALVCDDVADLDVDGLDAQYSPGAGALVRLHEVRKALLRGCRPCAHGAAFLKVEGKGSEGIALVGNDLRRVGTAAETAPEVAKGAVALAGNL